jgi:hypothetical protein
MLRAIAFSAAFAGASALAEEPRQREQPAPEVRRDGFVISGDACGASRFAHLVGEDYAEMYQASLLPADGNVVDRTKITTLEYTPERLNVVVNGQGRIIAIGCF